MTRLRPLPDPLAHAYLGLLGVEAEPGSVDADVLGALQRAHLERVPYETLDLVRGAPPPIDPVLCARRVVAGRGGYCFHLNGAFCALLEWLGVDVTRRVAGVQRWDAASPPGATGTHLVLTVRLRDDVVLLVDVGLGDGPLVPLPLVAGLHEVVGFAYRLRPSECVDGGWRFDHDPRGAVAGFDFAPEAAADGAFDRVHAHLSTDSRFSRIVTVQRRLERRIDILRGCVYTELDASGRRSVDVTDEGAWWAMVLDHFGLAYDDLDGAERDVLWHSVRAAHEAWDAAGRP